MDETIVPYDQLKEKYLQQVQRTHQLKQKLDKAVLNQRLRQDGLAKGHAAIKDRSRSIRELLQKNEELNAELDALRESQGQPPPDTSPDIFAEFNTERRELMLKLEAAEDRFACPRRFAPRTPPCGSKSPSSRVRMQSPTCPPTKPGRSSPNPRLSGGRRRTWSRRTST
jgi:hypothetical protein